MPAHRRHGLGHDIHGHTVAVRGGALEEGTTRVDEMREHLESLGCVSVAPPREVPKPIGDRKRPVRPHCFEFMNTSLAESEPTTAHAPSASGE